MSVPEMFLGSQVSNSYSIRVGEAKVTALLDSYVEFDSEIIVCNSNEGAALVAAWREEQAFVTINCFLIETGNLRVLVDTGVGGEPTENAGRLMLELTKLGFHPADITHVLFTHLHPDHAGGGVGATGGAAFPNAVYMAHRAERDHWFGNTPVPTEPMLAEMYEFSKTLTCLSPQFTWLEAGQVLPGIELVHLPGHTPGHSGYRVASCGETLLIWGDISHQPTLQFPYPEVCVGFDTDLGLAEKTRRNAMKYAEKSGELIAGMHASFPPFGWVKENQEGGFSFLQARWSPDYRHPSM